jgi:hypothetical protein
MGMSIVHREPGLTISATVCGIRIFAGRPLDTKSH